MSIKMKKPLPYCLFILVVMLVSSCLLFTLPDKPSSEPSDDTPDTEYMDLPDNPQEYFIFSEKRRKRRITIDLGKHFSTENEIDANDPDNDGFTNDIDPFPFDSSYPGIRFLSGRSNPFRLPLFGYNPASFDCSLSIQNNFGKVDPGSENHCSLTNLQFDRTALADLETDIDEFFDDMQIGTSLVKFSSNSNIETLDKYHPNSLNTDLSAGDGSEKALFNMIKIRGTDGLSYNYGSCTDEDNINELAKALFSSMRLLKHMKNRDLEEDLGDDEIRSILGLKSSLDWDDVINTAYTNLTGHPNTSITLSLDDFDNYSYSPVKNMFTHLTGWLSMGCENLFFSTSKPGQLPYFSNVNLVWSSLDNTVLYTPGLRSFDTAASIGLSGGDTYISNSDIDEGEAFILKIIVDRKYTASGSYYDSSTGYGESVLSIFLCSKDGFSFSIPIPFSSDLDFGYSTHAEAGFEIDDTSNILITYDIKNDQTKFRDIICRIDEDERSRINHEYYAYFIYAVPFLWDDNYGNEKKEWVVFGHNVHFWPAPDRNVVVAVLDKDNNVVFDQENEVLLGPVTLPYEYCVDPDAFTLYREGYDGTLFEPDQRQNNVSSYFADILNKFSLDFLPGQKLLCMLTKQDVSGDDEFGIDKVTLRDYGLSTDYDMQYAEIGKNDIPNSINNAALRALFGKFNSAAYTITPANSWPFNGRMYSSIFEIECTGLAVREDSGDDVSPPLRILLPEVNAGTAQKVFCDIDMSKCEHWIPNTADYAGPFTVRLDVLLDGTTTQALTNNPVTLASPADPFWGTNDAGQNNLHRNKGTGISLYAVFGTEYVKLASFQRQHTSFTPGEAAPYYVEL
ncbi:MAG: hypothetical protein JW874_04470, partial [Spirochaetales bacterium]|nr:hypothetical protein [Spirochaetales bacterium]